MMTIRESTHSDLLLARRLLAGDEAAFALFFERYFSGLYRFALLRMEHQADAAEEVAQATLCAAITKLSSYRGEAALFTWLCTFCRHEISAYYRRQARRPPEVELTEDNPAIRAALESLSSLAAGGPEESLEKTQLTQLVHVALDHLPARYARALEWKYMEGIAVVEIARRLELSDKAAESLLTRARQAFRDGFSALAGGRLSRDTDLPEPAEAWNR